MKMKHLCVPVKARVVIVLASCSLLVACGTSSMPAPPTVAIAATQHPLVAQYSLTSRCAGQARVNFGPTTSYGRSTAWYPVQGGVVGSTVNILVAGMRASTTYHMSSEFQCNGTTYNSPDQTFKTGPLAATAWPTLKVARPNPSLTSTENPGVEEVDLIGQTNKSPMMEAIVSDRDGNPIWYYDVGEAQGNWPYVYKLLPNGHMVFVIATSAQVTGGPILREVDLAGNTVRELDITTLAQKMQQAGLSFQLAFYHHDLLPLANGHLIVLGNYFQDFTNLPGYPGTISVVGDALVDLDPNWNPVWAWSTFDHLDINRHLNGLPDWTHANAVQYSADGNLWLSLRHQSWVIKIDYNNGSGTGDILWKLGYQGDFSLPTEDPSEWFSFQHYPLILSQNGSQTTFAVWDNGNRRVLDNNGDVCALPGLPGPTPCFSRAQIYQLDESAKTATLTWDFSPDYFGEWGGSINQFTNGNVEFDANGLWGPAYPSQVQEVTGVANPQIIWEMTVTPLPAYRAYRIPSLYPGVSWDY
jgi:arylsulfate sulfotransferase